MALIQEFYHPNIILMPVGAVADGQMPQMAWLAVTRYFEPDVVIPMHYGALPGSSTEEHLRKILGKDPRVVFMKPGETKSFSHVPMVRQPRKKSLPRARELRGDLDLPPRGNKRRLLVIFGQVRTCPAPSGEIRLDKSRAGVDVDLAQHRVAGVNESMPCIRGNDDDAPGFHFNGFIADRDGGTAFERECDLDVRMRVQWRACPGFASTM